MGIVCGHLGIGDPGNVELGGVKAVMRDFHGIEGMTAGDFLYAVGGFFDGEVIIRRMIENVEDIAVTFDPADVHVSLAAVDGQFHSVKEDEV